jgi:acylphosphatase
MPKQPGSGGNIPKQGEDVMTKSLHCLVSGKVQGVNFRSWVKGQAEHLGIKGWVRNLDDGRVEVLAQGPEDALQSLKGKLATGSTMSRVENMETKWIDYDKQHENFELRL